MAGHSLQHTMDMTSGPVLKKIISFSIPLMFSGLLQLFFNAADLIVVGQFAGDKALAAVGSVGSLVNLLVNTFLGFSVGGNVLASRYFGAKDERSLSATVHTAVPLGFVSGLIIAVIGFFGAPYFLLAMSNPPDIIGMSTLYLRIYFCGAPFMMLYNFCSSLLRAVGDTRRPLIILSAAGIINILFNLFFVIVLHMSVEGVAIATVISQVISAVFVMRCLIKEEGGMKLSVPKLLHPDKDKLKKLISIGLPTGLQSTMFSFSNILIQSSINSFGSVVVAGRAAAGNIEGFVYTAMNSFAQSALSFVGQNVGAKKYNRIYRVLLCITGCIIVVGGTLSALVYIFARPLLGIYIRGEESIAVGIISFQCICIPYFMCGIMDTSGYALRSLGRSVLPTVISLVFICVFRIVWILTVFRMPQYHSMQGLLSSYPISWILALIVFIPCVLISVNRLKKKGSDGSRE